MTKLEDQGDLIEPMADDDLRYANVDKLLSNSAKLRDASLRRIEMSRRLIDGARWSADD